MKMNLIYTDFVLISFVFLGAMRVQAYFKDAVGERANAELLMLSHYSPFNKHIRVSTSTVQAKVIRLIFIPIIYILF